MDGGVSEDATTAARGQKMRLKLPYISRFSTQPPKGASRSIALFADVFFPLHNGVVFALDGLCRELWITSLSVILVTPKIPRADSEQYAYADMRICLPSFPLPGGVGYRGIVPWLTVGLLRQLEGVALVHAHSWFLSGWLARAVAARKCVPLILTYHTKLEAYLHYAGPAQRLVRLCLRSYMRSFAARAQVVTVPTSACRTALRELGIDTRIEVLPQGIDTCALDEARPYSRQSLGCGPDERLILCVARLGQEKNIELLLAALARLTTPARLIVLGSGPRLSALQALGAELNLSDRVDFVGHCDRATTARYYRSCDVFAFPSLSETQGLVLAEALYAELPVVAIDTPQGREVVAESDAYLVAPEAAAFSAALEDVFCRQTTPALRAARKAVGARYDRRVTTQAMLDLYNELLSRA